MSRRKEVGRPDLVPLSVFLNDGVVPRASREDNHNQLGADIAQYLVVEPGDVVFNKLRTWQGGLGVSGHHGIVSPAYFVCRPGPGVFPRFLHYALRSAPYLQELTRVSKWMPPAQFDIGWEDLRDVHIRMPPFDTQRAIAAYLDAETGRIDGLVAGYEGLVSGMREQRAALTAAGVSGLNYIGEPRPSRLPWLEHIPKHWGEPKLTFVARLGSGHTPSRAHPEWWTDCTIPWITTGEVWQIREDRIEYLSETREKISELGVANSSAEIHPAGTVVLSRTASAGFSAIMANEMATSQDFVTWTCGPQVRPRYLLLCLRAMRPDLLGRLAMGSTHKTIHVPDVQSIRIPLPPLREQDAIVEWTWERLHRIDAIQEAIARQIDLLHERRQTLASVAVTGQLKISGLAA